MLDNKQINDEKDSEPDVRIEVTIAASRLTTSELCSMYLAVNSDHANPKIINGYDKIESLFTEKNGCKMHEKTKSAFLDYTIRQINKL